MLFVISGPSYVGKKTAIAHFMKLYSFSSIIPYTTKPYTHRNGETEGIQYHYVDEAARNDIMNERFIYDEPFNSDVYKEGTLYAYKKSDIYNAIESYSNFIIHASVGNAIKIYHEFSKYHRSENSDDDSWTQQLYLIFLSFESDLTPEFFKTRIPCNEGIPAMDPLVKKSGRQKTILGSRKGSDGNSGIAESDDFERRFHHAKKELSAYRECCQCFDHKISSDKAYEICEKLEDFILPCLKVMPSLPDKIPGPLSDTDILYMFEKRKRGPLVVYKR